MDKVLSSKIKDWWRETNQANTVFASHFVPVSNHRDHLDILLPAKYF